MSDPFKTFGTDHPALAEAKLFLDRGVLAESVDMKGARDVVLGLLGLLAEDWEADHNLRSLAPELYSALQAIGALPDGYCFCFSGPRLRSGTGDDHTWECRDARAVLAKAVDK